MTILKSIATALYNFAVPETEQVSAALEKLTPEQVRLQAVNYLKKEAPQLKAGTREYSQVHQATEDFVLLHHKASSFKQLCRSHVRRTATPTYYLHVTVGQVLQSQIDPSATKGGESAQLVERLIGEGVIDAATNERNPIKRRAILRNGIKAHYPGLTSDQLNFIAEAFITFSVVGE